MDFARKFRILLWVSVLEAIIRAACLKLANFDTKVTLYESGPFVLPGTNITSSFLDVARYGTEPSGHTIRPAGLLAAEVIITLVFRLMLAAVSPFFDGFMVSIRQHLVVQFAAYAISAPLIYMLTLVLAGMFEYNQLYFTAFMMLVLQLMGMLVYREGRSDTAVRCISWPLFAALMVTLVVQFANSASINTLPGAVYAAFVLLVVFYFSFGVVVEHYVHTRPQDNPSHLSYRLFCLDLLSKSVLFFVCLAALQ